MVCAPDTSPTTIEQGEFPLMRIVLQSAMIALLCNTLGVGETQQLPSVEHNHGHASVATSMVSRPLADLLWSISLEYGWTIDYEDPIYSDSEFIDVRSSERKLSHPNEKPYLLPRPASSSVEFTEDHLLSNSDSPKVLEQVVASYNSQDLPGVFTVQSRADGRVTIIGKDRRTGRSSLLDSSFNWGDTDELSGENLLERLSGEVRATSGLPVALGTVPMGLLSHLRVRRPPGLVTERDALIALLDSASVWMFYTLMYDKNDEQLILNIVPVHKRVTDATGNHKLIVVRR